MLCSTMERHEPGAPYQRGGGIGGDPAPTADLGVLIRGSSLSTSQGLVTAEYPGRGSPRAAPPPPIRLRATGMTRRPQRDPCSVRPGQCQGGIAARNPLPQGAATLG